MKSIDDYINELMQINKNAIPVQGEIEESDNMQGQGKIIVVVNGSNVSRPLKGVKVTFYENSGELIETVYTDENGKTGFINLPAPVRSLSTSPGASSENVFSLYNIKAEADNYVTSTINNVPVFDGVVSVQTFNLLWLPVSDNNTMEQSENEGNPYNL